MQLCGPACHLLHVGHPKPTPRQVWSLLRRRLSCTSNCWVSPSNVWQGQRRKMGCPWTFTSPSGACPCRTFSSPQMATKKSYLGWWIVRGSSRTPRPEWRGIATLTTTAGTTRLCRGTLCVKRRCMTRWRRNISSKSLTLRKSWHDLSWRSLVGFWRKTKRPLKHWWRRCLCLEHLPPMQMPCSAASLFAFWFGWRRLDFCSWTSSTVGHSCCVWTCVAAQSGRPRFVALSSEKWCRMCSAYGKVRKPMNKRWRTIHAFIVTTMTRHSWRALLSLQSTVKSCELTASGRAKSTKPWRLVWSLRNGQTRGTLCCFWASHVKAALSRRNLRRVCFIAWKMSGSERKQVT